MDNTSIDPQLIELGASLAEAGIRNTASAIATRIRAAKAKKNDKEAINELEEIINSLITDKNELVQIAEAYKQELVAQQITPDEIEYITESFIPRLKQIVEQTASGATAANLEQFMDVLRPLLSVEMLTVLQLVGFNFKKAIGEPLTLLLQKAITSRVPAAPQNDLEYRTLLMAFNVELAKIAQDEETSARWERLRGPIQTDSSK